MDFRDTEIIGCAKNRITTSEVWSILRKGNATILVNKPYTHLSSKGLAGLLERGLLEIKNGKGCAVMEDYSNMVIKWNSGDMLKKEEILVASIEKGMLIIDGKYALMVFKI